MSRLKLTVVLNGKAVGLLLNLPDQGENRRNGLDTDFPPVRMDQRPGTVAVVLHHTKGGNLQVQGLQHPRRHLYMLMSAIDQKQVRLVRKLFIPVQIPAEPAGEHLFH